MELAHRGTIFLDEIGELPIAIQSKLLRVLEEKRFDRVGGTQSTEVDVRILAATNKDLRGAVAARLFREDLFFRIAGVPITIPPLRERGNDVLLLADAFLDRFRREFRKPALQLTDQARDALLAYQWPGNVRELQNTMERAAILSDGNEIDAAALQLSAQRPSEGQMPAGMLNESFSWEGTMQDVSARALEYVERFKIGAALQSSRWNKTRAAEHLGISYKTLLTKIRALGLEE
jgi:transcriptional regulator with GAF, ATPase, and Fis domain